MHRARALDTSLEGTLKQSSHFGQSGGPNVLDLLGRMPLVRGRFVPPERTEHFGIGNLFSIVYCEFFA